MSIHGHGKPGPAGPAQPRFAALCLFQCFEEKEYQTESKRNEINWRSYFWKESHRIDLDSTSEDTGASHEGGGRAHPLGHTPCYSAVTAASHCSRTIEPSYSSPRGLPLPRLPWLRVVPFLGVAVIHRPGALGAAWSTTNFHRKSTVRREVDSWVQAATRKCLLITRKIIIPPPDSRDPPDGPPYFAKKPFPLTAGTHRTGHRIS